MNITNEQKKLLTILCNNKKVLDELIKIGSTQQKQAKDLQMKESITVAGITWSKFAEDSKGNAYMLADKSICNMKFGENNNWKKSLIRDMLNEELYQKVIAELGADALVTIHTDLISMDGFDDYGKCDDLISLLTFDLYRNNSKNIPLTDSPYWLATPNQTPSRNDGHYVQYVYGDGDMGCCGFDEDDVGVRPFFILKFDTFIL